MHFLRSLWSSKSPDAIEKFCSVIFSYEAEFIILYFWTEMNKCFDNFDHFSSYITTTYAEPKMWNNFHSQALVLGKKTFEVCLYIISWYTQKIGW